MPSEADFFRSSVALRCAELRAGDFERSLADVSEGDFVYLDPPYAASAKRSKGNYGYNSFGEEDIPRLLTCLGKIDAVGASFLLSYSGDPTVARDFSQWSIRNIKVKRHVAGFAQHRHEVPEIVVSNRELPILN
jgi:DNA adenine methylase